MSAARDTAPASERRPIAPRPLSRRNAHDVIGRVRITERLQFVATTPGAARGSYEWLEAGVVVDRLQPSESDRRDMADRERAGRPEQIAIRWNDKARLIPRRAAVDVEREDA